MSCPSPQVPVLLGVSHSPLSCPSPFLSHRPLGFGAAVLFSGLGPQGPPALLVRWDGAWGAPTTGGSIVPYPLTASQLTKWSGARKARSTRKGLKSAPAGPPPSGYNWESPLYSTSPHLPGKLASELLHQDSKPLLST